MNLIFLGPPGAGKGTQAVMCAKKYNLAHISTGDIFRDISKNGSKLGNQIQDFMISGKLVPDNIVIEAVKERLNQSDCIKGFVLDGFPRNVSQAISLDAIINEKDKKISNVIYIFLEHKVIVERLSGRRTCEKCGRGYNIIFNPSKNLDKCDYCLGKLIQRKDDNSNTIEIRLKTYEEQTKSLIDYYNNKGILKKIDGSKTIEEVFKNICEFIE